MENTTATNQFSAFLWESVDHRVDHMLFMSSTRPLILLLLAYFAMVYFGPRIMHKREPWEMTRFLIAYNIFIILLNFYIAAQLLIGALRRRYTWICDVPDYRTIDAEEMRIVNAIHLYSMSKFIEWLDTFCFIVRKKTSQLTFLHVYHHSTMAVFCWVVTRWMASGSTFLPMFINSIVHVVMYGYYVLAAMGPKVRKYLWWKRYITTLQLTQFFIGFVFIGNGILTGCKYNPVVVYVAFLYDIGYIFLFGAFYRNNYVIRKYMKKEKRSETKEDIQFGNGTRATANYIEGNRKRTVVTALS